MRCILRYAQFVQSSAYQLSVESKTLDVNLSAYCQWFPLHNDKCYCTNKCLQYDITTIAIFKTTQKCRFMALQNGNTFSFQHCEKL